MRQHNKIAAAIKIDRDSRCDLIGAEDHCEGHGRALSTGKWGAVHEVYSPDFPMKANAGPRWRQLWQRGVWE